LEEKECGEAGVAADVKEEDGGERRGVEESRDQLRRDARREMMEDGL
jgi:hypothetical protein